MEIARDSFISVFFLLGACILCSCTGCTTAKTMVNYIDYMDELHPTTEEISGVKPGDNINGFLPEKIFIKTASQTFNREYQFCLVDGHVYYKAYKEKGINENLVMLG